MNQRQSCQRSCCCCLDFPEPHSQLSFNESLRWSVVRFYCSLTPLCLNVPCPQYSQCAVPLSVPNVLHHALNILGVLSIQCAVPDPAATNGVGLAQGIPNHPQIAPQ